MRLPRGGYGILATACASASIALALAATLPGCPVRKESTTVNLFDERANGQEIRLPLGATFLVRLEERPTSGFRWRLVSDGAPTCELVEDHFEPPPDPTPGRAGHHSWTFKIARAGRAAIELATRRAWEQDAPPASTFTVSVRSE